MNKIRSANIDAGICQIDWILSQNKIICSKASTGNTNRNYVFMTQRCIKGKIITVDLYFSLSRGFLWTRLH